MKQLKEEFWEFGFVWVRSAATLRVIGETLSDLAGVLSSEPSLGSKGVIDDLPLMWPELSTSSCGRLMQALACELFGNEVALVTGLFFDKPAGAEPVGAHQDLFVPVLGRIDEPSFVRWSDRGGYHYVSPPDAVLAGCVALRLHLDPCPAGMGEVSIWPRSHARRWSRAEVDEICETSPTPCIAEAGDVLLMSPLAIHRSEPVTRSGSRRVVHLVYSSAKLPDGLRWVNAASFKS